MNGNCHYRSHENDNMINVVHLDYITLNLKRTEDFNGCKVITFSKQIK